MLDLRDIEERLEFYKSNLSMRGVDSSYTEEFSVLNLQRKKLLQEFEQLRSEIKSMSKEIGTVKKSGGDAQDLIEKVGELKKKEARSESSLSELKEKLDHKLLSTPNILDDVVPMGVDENDNYEVRSWGEKQSFDFKPQGHADLGENLGMLDFKAAAKISGARFVVYRQELAQMERALASLMIDIHTENGYEEILPPYIVNSPSFVGTGQLPKFKEDMFKIEGRDSYLISTAETPLTNLVRESMMAPNEMPIKLCAFTPCFRSEAGSYGKDTRGLVRVHQFNKVEMVNIVHPDHSRDAHEEMLGQAEKVLQALDLPYRVMLLCSGDTGFSAHKCYDIEVWLPGQDTYREISSVSNCIDFQARRAQIRFRDSETGKPRFAHTLNGSGLAVGRTIVAILENYQQEDGSIIIPKALRPYMGGKELIQRK